METMTSLERSIAVLENKIPDRLPVGLHNFLMACDMVKADLRVTLKDGEALAEAQLNAWRQFGHDVIMHENGVCAEAEALGCEVYYQPDLPPHVEGRIINCFEDIDNLPDIPDPEKVFPLNEMLKATRIMVKETKGKVFIMGRADQGPMALASALCGPEAFLLMTMDEENRHRIDKLLDFCTKVNCAYGEAQIRAGAHGSSIGAYGTSLISPEMYDDLELPGNTAFATAMRNVGAYSFIHSCGKEDHLIENMIRTGASCLELDPATDPTICKEMIHRKISVLGMLDPGHILWRGTPEAVREHTLDIMRIMAPQGNFIVGPGCSLPPDVTPETIHVIMECARKEGVYNADGSMPAFQSSPGVVKA
jgi:MtaA/CmuA family methyltransferase